MPWCDRRISSTGAESAQPCTESLRRRSKIANPKLTAGSAAHRYRRERNNSDIDFCEFKGRCGSPIPGQPTSVEHLAEAVYEGMRPFSKGWFPPHAL
jgi:hypothetical protein